MSVREQRAGTRRERRANLPPGGTNRLSTESSFSPPVGSRWREEIGSRGYYIDFSVKADSPEWPPQWLRADDDQLHVATVQWGLGAWERYLAGEGENWLAAAFSAADHLIQIQIEDGAREGSFLQWIPMPHTYRVDPPWASAITQGEAASLFARLYAQSRVDRYAEAAQRALRPMCTPTNAGGILADVDGAPLFEEYPTQPASLVLNGAIFALWGFYDVADSLGDRDARGWYERGVDSLASLIDRYDTGRWSRYDLYPHPLPNVASSAYHLLHINQLNVLGRLTGRPEFEAVRSRFESYRASRLCRMRALAEKVAFRLATPRNALFAQRLPWNNRARRRLADQDMVVLCYHGVSDTWDSTLSVTTEQLAQEVRYLRNAGYKPTTFTEGVMGPRPQKSFAVTFDDAYLSVAEKAKPVLDDLGVCGTVFVPTAFADDPDPMTWPGISEWVGGPHEGELRPMSWDMLMTLADAGWEIGSHTSSHPRLTELPDQGVLAELRRSREDCERRLGRPCLSLAYPYGAYDHRVTMLAAEAGYTTAAALPPPFSEEYVLAWPRIGVYPIDSGWRFRLKVARPIRWLRRTRVGPLIGFAAHRRAHRPEVPS